MLLNYSTKSNLKSFYTIVYKNVRIRTPERKLASNSTYFTTLMSNVISITGLSAPGKTTIAKGLVKRLKDKNIKTVLLDGDSLRQCLDVIDLYSFDDRKKLAFVYAKLANMISKQGTIVIVATIALFKEIHLWNRENIEGYFEVFLDIPIKVLKDRDPKGIYKKYDRGEIKHVAGLDLEVSFPTNPHLHIKYDPEKTAGDLIQEILNKFLET